jgi:hypothetical protein
MNSDIRSWRMAVVPDALINPPRGVRGTLCDVLGLLEASGYGVVQLPPPGKHPLLLAVIADQLAEYSHHGYAVVAIGVLGETDDGLHWRRLASLLRHRGVPLPPRHMIRPDVDVALEELRLTALLANYDLPAEEQSRWRV